MSPLTVVPGEIKVVLPDAEFVTTASFGLRMMALFFPVILFLIIVSDFGCVIFGSLLYYHHRGSVTQRIAPLPCQDHRLIQTEG
jgi:hypothetical protein